MADKHTNIDVNTLQEVERLLTSTEFAGPEQIATTAALGALSEQAASPAPAPEPVDADSATPLPRRR